MSQTVYFTSPSQINSLQNTVNGYQSAFTTNVLNVNTINFANDNVFGNVNSATGVQWVTQASTGAFVCADDNYACQAALQCMASGGNAFDAAVTAMAVIGLTRPGNGGLGGGGYAVMYHKDTNRVDCMDFRETAPLKIDPYCFSSGAPYSTYNGSAFTLARAKQQGYSVGVPGTPLFMKELLDRYGTYNLGQCFYPAIKLATEGFYLDQPFVDLINVINTGTNAPLSNFTGSRLLFLDPSTSYTKSYPVGTLFKNPDYAATLQLCANTNMKAFYYGSIAQDIVNCVQNPPKIGVPSISITGGNMTMEDLALYQVLTKAPIKISFRDCFVYVMPPSTSGGLLIAQALKIYEALVPSPTGGYTGCADSYFARQMAMRYAFADRNAFVADPAFYPVPTQGMIDSGYIASRAAICPTGYNTFTSTANIAPYGSPTGFYTFSPTGSMLFSAGASVDPTNAGSTTPLIVKDNYGNAISITFTIEQILGSGMTVPGRGFLLNNELTDFNNLQPGVLPTANSPQPGKRPRSSTAPTIVMKNGIPYILASCAGGTQIPMTIFNAIVNIVDYGYTTENALLEANYFESNGQSVSVDSQANYQRDSLGSAFSLLTTYKGYPSSGYFSIAATGVSFGGGTMSLGINTSTGSSCGLKWPSTQYFATNQSRWGSSKAQNTISYSNTGTWTAPV